MRITTLVLCASAVFAGAPVAVEAQAATYTRDVPDSLLKAARVPEARAAALALARVPNGKIRSLELEREHGALIYSFEIKVAGKAGITEVNVNAMTGRVGPLEHEKD